MEEDSYTNKHTHTLTSGSDIEIRYSFCLNFALSGWVATDDKKNPTLSSRPHRLARTFLAEVSAWLDDL